MSAAEPTGNGFRDHPGFPFWLTWTAPDKSWEVELGDDSDAIHGAPLGAKVITVSAGPYAGPRWFGVTDPRGLAAALLAAADRAEADQ
ncbi:MAG: hypothetical protein ACXVGF_04530 [Blastococcus sp.]